MSLYSNFVRHMLKKSHNHILDWMYVAIIFFLSAVKPKSDGSTWFVEFIWILLFYLLFIYYHQTYWMKTEHLFLWKFSNDGPYFFFLACWMWVTRTVIFLFLFIYLYYFYDWEYLWKNSYWKHLRPIDARGCPLFCIKTSLVTCTFHRG